jgi:indolepyruvate decarboxylase
MPALPDKPELACMNLTESLLHALKDHGARQIFGIPGDFALPYFRIIEESGSCRCTRCRTSRAWALRRMRARIARINGSLGVAAVTYGAGALNMINSVAAAYAEKSPLVVLSGGPGKGESAPACCCTTRPSAGFAVPDLRGDHLRPRPAGRRRARAGRHRPGAGELPEAFAPRLPGDPARHGRLCPARRCRPSRPAVDPDALAACADEVLQRLASRPSAGADGGRGGAPLRAGGPGGRAGAAPRRCRW